jgi:hypothetical protein
VQDTFRFFHGDRIGLCCEIPTITNVGARFTMLQPFIKIYINMHKVEKLQENPRNPSKCQPVPNQSLICFCVLPLQGDSDPNYPRSPPGSRSKSIFSEEVATEDRVCERWSDPRIGSGGSNLLNVNFGRVNYEAHITCQNTHLGACSFEVLMLYPPKSKFLGKTA